MYLFILQAESRAAWHFSRIAEEARSRRLAFFDRILAKALGTQTVKSTNQREIIITEQISHRWTARCVTSEKQAPLASYARNCFSFFPLYFSSRLLLFLLSFLFLFSFCFFFQTRPAQFRFA